VTYLAPIVTAVLAVLGIFFSKEGKLGELTRIGYTILALTLVSGGLAVYDVYDKDRTAEAQRTTIEKLQRDGHALSNLFIASVLGLDQKLDYATLWLSTDALDADAIKEREQFYGRSLREDEYIPETIDDAFIGLIVSKADAGQRISINGSFLGHELNFSIRPKNKESFIVEQKIDGKSRTYECNSFCNDIAKSRKAAVPLDQRNTIWTDEVGAEHAFGIDFADGGSVARVISALQGPDYPFLKMTASFSDKQEFNKLERVLRGIHVQLKLYTSKKHGRAQECILAVIAPVRREVHYDTSRLTMQMELKGIDTITLNLCEDQP